MDTRSIALVCFLAGALGLATAPCSAGAEKQPVGVFDVAKSLPPSLSTRFVVQRFRANDNGLYFYITPGPRVVGGFILETDLRGTTHQVITLPPGAEVHDIDADASGQLRVLAVDGGTSHLLGYDSKGTLVEDLALAQYPAAFCKLGGATLGLLSGTGAIVDLRGGQFSSPHVDLRDSRRAPIMLCDPAGKVVLVERTAAVIHVVSPAAGDIVLSPRTPEMSWSSSIGSSSAHNVVFLSAAVCPEGGMYVALGHFKLAGGAPVLHINGGGDVVETIRLTLPRFGSLVESENPAGFMTARQIGVAGPLMFLESGDGKVAYYKR